jgi:adhesin transport system outer membrane protein
LPFQTWNSPFAPALEPKAVLFGDRWASQDLSNANALFVTSGQVGQGSVSADASAGRR